MRYNFGDLVILNPYWKLDQPVYGIVVEVLGDKIKIYWSSTSLISWHLSREVDSLFVDNKDSSEGGVWPR
jgi:hypothetical protein